jgi:hypothetical protein
MLLVWSVTLAQVWTHYKIGKLNMWTLFCNICIDFLNIQIWKENMLELNGKPSSVLPSPWLIFPSNILVFLGIYFNFQQQKSLLNQYLSHSESKSYQINFIKSCSSTSFQQHQSHIPIPPKFSAMIKFNFQWKNHSIFKNFCIASPNAMEPSQCTPPPWELSKETKNMIWSILVRWISYVQNKQTTFFHR